MTRISKRRFKLLASSALARMPDYQPSDNAAVQGDRWDAAPDWDEAVKPQRFGMIDEGFDDLQR